MAGSKKTPSQVGSSHHGECMRCNGLVRYSSNAQPISSNSDFCGMSAHEISENLPTLSGRSLKLQTCGFHADCAGSAALAICESLLLARTELRT